MKFWAIVCCGLIVSGSANAAADGENRGMGSQLLVQDQRPQPGPQRGAERPMPRRDTRGTDENDRGRMNPEERRQLRRDIRDAGQDIYRPAPQERRDNRRSGRR